MATLGPTGVVLQRDTRMVAGAVQRAVCQCYGSRATSTVRKRYRANNLQMARVAFAETATLVHLPVHLRPPKTYRLAIDLRPRCTGT